LLLFGKQETNIGDMPKTNFEGKSPKRVVKISSYFIEGQEKTMGDKKKINNNNNNNNNNSN